jgi:hypothetical protein
MTALWLAVRHPAMRRAAAVIAAATLAWVVVSLAVIIPHFAIQGGNPQLRRYDGLGSGPGGILHTLVTRPWRPVEILATPHRLAYLAALLLPLLALPLAAPLLAAGALPQLGLNLFASSGPAQSVQYHYAAVVTPFLVAASLLGLARLRERGRPARLRPLLARPGAVGLTLVGAVILAGASLGPLPFWESVPLGFDGSPHNRFTMDAQARALERAVALVPPGAAVSASNEPGAHLSARRRVMLFPTIADAHWVLVDAPAHALRAGEGRRTLRPAEYRARLAALEASRRWHIVFQDHGVRLFRLRPGVRAPVVPQR